MFVLIYSDNELLSSDNQVKAFATLELAQKEMVRQFLEAVREDGYEECEVDSLGDVKHNGVFLGFVAENEAYVDDGEAKWAIFEVKE